jgi:hypothetical protein
MSLCLIIFRLSETGRLLHYYQSNLKYLEILVQQKNSFHRFAVSVIVLKLSFSYSTAIKYMSIYTQKQNSRLEIKKKLLTKSLEIDHNTDDLKYLIELNYSLCLKFK